MLPEHGRANVCGVIRIFEWPRGPMAPLAWGHGVMGTGFRNPVTCTSISRMYRQKNFTYPIDVMETCKSQTKN